MLEFLNVSLTLFVGLLRTWRSQSRWVLVLSVTVALNALLLGRLEQALSIDIATYRIGGLEILPLLLIPCLFVARVRIARFGQMCALFVWAMLILAGISFMRANGDLLAAACALITFIGPMLLGVVSSCLPRRDAEIVISKIYLVAVIIGTLSVVSVVGSALIGGILGWQTSSYRSLSPLGGPIASGAVLILAWPEFLERVLRRPTILNIISAAVIVSAVLFSGSRVIVATAAVQTAWVILARQQRSVLRSLMAIALIVGITAVMVQRAPDTRALERLTTRVGETTGDTWRAVSFWTGLSLIYEKPLLGWGPGQVYQWFRNDLPAVNPVISVGSRLSLIEPHNTYLYIAVEYGLLVLLGFLFVIGRTLVWVARARGFDRLQRVVGLAGFFLQAVGSSHLLVNVRVGAIFWIFAGAVVAISISDQGGDTHVRVHHN